jgi:predicted phage terminase large subunit-like protein
MSETRQAKIGLALALQERLRRNRLALAEKAKTDLFTFFRHYAWPVLEPTREYIHGWHVDAICEHLMAVHNGQISNLIINMPFRMLKSTLVTQTFPAWEWTTQPGLQFLTASYATKLATRDAVKSRNIIESQLYQQAFGSVFHLTSDQNVKSHYENNKRGHRFISSTDAGATGFGGDRILLDDPLNTKEADSEAARESSIEFIRGTLSTRMNDPNSGASIVVHQRLHERDATGFLMEEQPGVWEHLILPMRYEPKCFVFINGKRTEVDTKTVMTATGFVDPRNEPGELLNPERLGDVAVAKLEKAIGAYHTAAQLQQNPTSRGGVIFARGDWNFYKALPELEELVLSVDCSFKDTDGTDFVSIQVIGRKGANKYLVKRIKERMGFGATVKAVRSVRAAYPRAIAVLIEDKANGSAVVETLKVEIPGVIAITPDGGKEARAYAIQPQHEAGNFWLPDPSLDSDIETFLTELSAFPGGPHDDEVDAWTQGINWYASRERNMGMLDFYKQQNAELEAQRKQKNAH